MTGSDRKSRNFPLVAGALVATLLAADHAAAQRHGHSGRVHAGHHLAKHHVSHHAGSHHGLWLRFGHHPRHHLGGRHARGHRGLGGIHVGGRHSLNLPFRFGLRHRPRSSIHHFDLDHERRRFSRRRHANRRHHRDDHHDRDFTVYTFRTPKRVVVRGGYDRGHGGWDDLARGKEARALKYFTNRASHNPRDGGAKIGYALASALLGDDHRAVWAMRRAFRIDPYSVKSIPAHEALHDRLERLAHHYKRLANRRRNPADAEFMLAAVSFLTRDYATAQRAIHNAIKHGDRSSSAAALKDLIPNEKTDRRRDSDDY